MQEQLGTRVAVSARWVTASTIATSFSAWATALVLARLLDRHTFGLAALAMLAVAILQLFQDSGLHAALIQRRTRIREAADSAALYAPLAGISLGALCFLAAPLSARFFGEPEVRGLVEGLGAVFALRSLAIVPMALIQREMLFARVALVSTGGSLIYFGATVTLALLGAGAWSVIGGQIALAAWGAGATWALSPWRPDPRRASLAELRELLRYGRHIVAGNVVGFVNSYSDPVGVGRLYGAASLGAYTLGFQTGRQAVTLVTGISNVVVFPAYAKLQDDIARFRAAYLRSLRFICMISTPAAFGLAAVSTVLVPALYGEKWSAAIPVLTVISFHGWFLSVSATTGEVFKAAGRPQLFFRMGIFQMLVLLAAIGAFYPFGITGFAIARATAAFVMAGVALGLAGRILQVAASEWLRALRAPTLAAAIMAAIVAGTEVALRWVGVGDGPALAALVVEGALVYGAALRLLACARWHEFVDELLRLVPLGRLSRTWPLRRGALPDPPAAAVAPGPRLDRGDTDDDVEQTASDRRSLGSEVTG